MSFTCSDAISLALTENWLDETLDSVQVLTWGTNFLRRIVKKDFWAAKTQVFNGSLADTWYALPADFIRSIEIQEANGVIAKRSYSIRNGQIKFAISGSYTLLYIQYPTVLATITTAVPLPDAFLYPMSEYMVFKFYNMENDDKDRKDRALEYESRYKESLRNIYENIEVSNRIEVTIDVYS